MVYACVDVYVCVWCVYMFVRVAGCMTDVSSKSDKISYVTSTHKAIAANAKQDRDEQTKDAHAAEATDAAAAAGASGLDVSSLFFIDKASTVSAFV